MLHSRIIHIQPYAYTCGNIVNTIITREHTSLEKYISHTLFEMVAKVLCVRGELETELRLQYIDPQFLYLQQHFILVLLGCSTGSPEGPALCQRVGSHCLGLQQLTPNSLNFLSHRVISLFDPVADLDVVFIENFG